MAGKKGMHDKYRFGAEWQDKLRTKIQAHRIVDKLTDHVVNGTEMSQSQVTAGLGLLRKVLPELASTDSTITHKTNFVDALERMQQQIERNRTATQTQTEHTPHVTH